MIIIVTTIQLEKADINRNHISVTWWASVSCFLFLFYSFSNSTWALAPRLLIMAPENLAIGFSQNILFGKYISVLFKTYDDIDDDDDGDADGV